MGDPDKKALQILRRVLAEYPKPVAIPAKTPGPQHALCPGNKSGNALLRDPVRENQDRARR
jgi:hypothetical protein